MLYKNGKLDVEGLKRIFTVIDYRPSEAEFEATLKNLFRGTAEINFDAFLRLYSLDLEPTAVTDIKNAFHLLGEFNSCADRKLGGHQNS